MPYEHLSDRELVALILGAKATERLYTPSLSTLISSARNDAKYGGKLLAAIELSRRMLRETIHEGPVLQTPQAVRDYLRLTFLHREHEVFIAVYLDAQNRVIAVEELFRGTLTTTAVYPREVVKQVLKHNAASVIFAHNHPSGVSEPSSADKNLTQVLVQALALVDVRVLDHFVVGTNSVTSFAEQGRL